MSYTGKELIEVIKQQPISIFTDLGPEHMDVVKVYIEKYCEKISSVKVFFKDSTRYDFDIDEDEYIDLDYIMNSNGMVNVSGNLINTKEIKFVTCNYEDVVEQVYDYYMKDYGFKLEWCDETNSFDIV